MIFSVIDIKVKIKGNQVYLIFTYLTVTPIYTNKCIYIDG